MATFAFWNLGQRTPPELVAALLVENEVDLFASAEQPFEDRQLRRSYRALSGVRLYSTRSSSKRIRFYSRERRTLRPLMDSHYFSVCEYLASGTPPITVAAVHLPSKLHKREYGQGASARRLAQNVERLEEQAGHARTIVMGDFNMDPFEPGIAGSDSLHAVMDRRIALKRYRTVDFEQRPFFYNPMWRIMGNHEATALGTYYRAAGDQLHYFWHTFDQVLVRPSLLSQFDDAALRVVARIGERSLVAQSGLGIESSVCDHLPIIFKVRPNE